MACIKKTDLEKPIKNPLFEHDLPASYKGHEFFIAGSDLF